MIDPMTGRCPRIHEVGLRPLHDRHAAITDGTSNTVFMAEVLQGELYDVRGLMWSTIPGGWLLLLADALPTIPWTTTRRGIFGDYLNSRSSASTSRAGPALHRRRGRSEPAFAGARSRHPGGINVLLRRRLGPVHQEQRQHAGLAGPEHDQRRRGHQRRLVLIARVGRGQ